VKQKYNAPLAVSHVRVAMSVTSMQAIVLAVLTVKTAVNVELEITALLKTKAQPTIALAVNVHSMSLVKIQIKVVTFKAVNVS